MLKFAANLGFLFTDLPFMERFSAAKKAGFRAVEFMFPYDYDLDEIEKQLQENGLVINLFNLPAGNWAAGERGTATDPTRKEEFRAGVAKAIEAARKFNVKTVNCLVGKVVPAVSEEKIWATLVENISYAADALNEHGIKLMVEPINHYDMPGFYINTTQQALKLIADVNKENVYLQYDIYHADREEEDHNEILKNHMAKIGHIQIADNPGRHQPGTGKIDLKHLLAEIEKAGYNGYVGLEYVPEPDTLTSLKWLEEFGYKL